jgi:polyhydroxyalkanoic acid synthase PhaR subunit
VMESRQSFDPFTLWRDFYNRAEQAWTEAVQRSISTPTFAETMGQTSQTLLNNLEVWRNFAERYVTEVWNLPTRNDLGRLGEVVVAIDAKADDLDDRVDHLDEAIGRVDQRLAAVEGQLATVVRNTSERRETPTDQLADRVTGLERRLDDLLSRTEQILTRLDGRTPSGRTTGERATGQRASDRRASGESGTKQEAKQETKQEAKQE